MPARGDRNLTVKAISNSAFFLFWSYWFQHSRGERNHLVSSRSEVPIAYTVDDDDDDACSRVYVPLKGRRDGQRTGVALYLPSLPPSISFVPTLFRIVCESPRSPHVM